MLLSFVVPAYNEEAYLGACLESILAQTRGIEHLTEIIVVNNASTDRTREIALRYARQCYARQCGPRVRLVDEPRKGLPFARQAGFIASSGSLIANVDSDSRLTPGWVDRVLRTFREHEARKPALAALSGPLVYYDLAPRQRRLVSVFYLIAWLTYAANKYVLRIGSMVQGGNFVLSRAALEAIGGYDTSITFYGEDTDIARRLHSVGKVLFTFDLKMLSSARRLKQEGMLTMAFRYALNYFWTTLFKHPFTREHIDIREREPIDIRDQQLEA
jgi:glycosyltransferase involved in cell wall biosynthesis